MANALLNLDVDDIERAVRFYTEAFQLQVGRRFDSDFVELLGLELPLYLLKKSAGSQPFAEAARLRDYGRHWTPLHLDLVVPDIDAAIERALTAGATLEVPARTTEYGRLALLHDPFGHGFCLLEFRGQGYDALLGQRR